MTKNLTKDLIDWYERSKRDLPWRETKDPYSIWISEVILQQTRVAQGLPYYHRFIERFPDVVALANAMEDEVLRLWEGLGYYSRARNLHAGAKYIAFEQGGIFPDNYEALLKVKGIGPYTAAAISSICFDEASPVLDGNVFRVVSRLYAVYDDIANAANRKVFIEILDQIIDHQQPGHFNQAMMELGATICLPTNPSCIDCPVEIYCHAKRRGVQKDLPVKIKKLKVRDRYFHYLVLRHKGSYAMRKRESGDVWQGLYEFYLDECERNGTPKFLNYLSVEDSINVSEVYKHILTHQKIYARFYLVDIKSSQNWKKLIDSYQLKSYTLSEVVTLPKPKLIVNYLTQLDK